MGSNESMLGRISTGGEKAKGLGKGGQPTTLWGVIQPGAIEITSDDKKERGVFTSKDTETGREGIKSALVLSGCRG